MGALEKNNNMSYLILDTPSLQGSSLQVEAVTVYDRIHNPLSNSGYTTNIVKVDDKYFLVFGEANDVGNPNYPQTDATPPGGHVPGYGQEDGGSGGSSDNKPNTSTPPSSDPIYNAIYEALDGSIINNNNLIRTAASTVEKQIETMQDERKTHQGNLIYHNMLGRIAHLNKINDNYALNTKDKFASLASDYKPYYVNLEEQESNNFYISALAGYSNYKNSSGSEFGLSFGYDKEVLDEFFAGFYASISNSRIETEGMYLDCFNHSLGLYSRAYLPYSLELDTLAYY